MSYFWTYCVIIVFSSFFNNLCYQKFSESLIRKLFYKLSWKNLLAHQILPVDIIEIIIFDSNRIIDNQDWFNICSKQPITYEFIETYEQKIQWHPVSSNKHCVSFELIDKYYDKLIWQEVTKHGINEHILVISLKHIMHSTVNFSVFFKIEGSISR